MKALLVIVFLVTSARAQCDAASFAKCPVDADLVQQVQYGNKANGMPFCMRPVGVPGPAGPAGPQGPAGVCPACPPTGGGTTTGDTIVAKTLRLGVNCKTIEETRGKPGAVGEKLCTGGGDILQVVTAGTYATTRPTAYPMYWRESDRVETSGLVYPSKAIIDPPLVFRAATACTLGAKAPTWCRSMGCVQRSGSCSLTAIAAPRQSQFADGTVRLNFFGADIGISGEAVYLGSSFPAKKMAIGLGDNEDQPTETFDRGGAGNGQDVGYGPPDESRVSISFGDGRSGLPVLGVTAGSLHPGLLSQGPPTAKIEGTPPPELIPVPGPFRAGTQIVAATAWINSLWGAPSPRTRRAVYQCPTDNCNVKVMQRDGSARPNGDGYMWPVFGPGRPIGVVYVGIYGPGPLPEDRYTFMLHVDYLLDSSDSVEASNEEFENPVTRNFTGQPGFATYDNSVGFGHCVPGGVAGIGMPCLPPPGQDTGFWYAVRASNTPPGCRHGDRRRNQSITLGTVQTGGWRTDRIPFCDDRGVQYERLGPANTNTAFTASGYPWSCMMRFFAPRLDGKGLDVIAGFCNDATPQGLPDAYGLEFYEPGNPNVIRSRLDSRGLFIAP